MEVLRALAVLAEAPGPAHHDLAAAAGLPAPPSAEAHTELFRFQLPPYASVYLGPEGMLGGEARDRIAGFWRALDATPPREPDHLATLLAAHASLGDRDREAGAGSPWRAARHAFFWEHLASWLPPYLARAGELGGPFHQAWAAAVRDALGDEAAALGPPTAASAHFAAAPPPDDDGALVDALLAPARSGVILTRRDLRAAASGLGLGLRQGERRFVLKWLLQQDPAGTLAWLAGEAGRQAERLGGATGGAAAGDAGPASASSSSALEPVLAHWRGRARRTAELLDRAAHETLSPFSEAAHA